MATTTHTVTFVGADDATTRVSVDDQRFPLGQPVRGVDAKTVRRLRAIPGHRFEFTRDAAPATPPQTTTRPRRTRTPRP